MFAEIYELAKAKDSDKLSAYLIKNGIIGEPGCNPLKHPKGLGNIANQQGYTLIQVLSLEGDIGTLDFLLKNFRPHFTSGQQTFMGADFDANRPLLRGDDTELAYLYALGGHTEAVELLLNSFPRLSISAQQGKDDRNKLMIRFIFDNAICQIANINAEPDKKKELAKHLQALKSKTVSDHNNKKISVADALDIAVAADTLVFNIRAVVEEFNNVSIGKTSSADNSLVANPKFSINVFKDSTKKFRSFDWKVILGAVIGAAVGIIIGACIGIAAGPAAALTALAGGTYGAIWGATLFGAGFAALGGLVAHKVSTDAYRDVEATALKICPNK